MLPDAPDPFEDRFCVEPDTVGDKSWHPHGASLYARRGDAKATVVCSSYSSAHALILKRRGLAKLRCASEAHEKEKKNIRSY